MPGADDQRPQMQSTQLTPALASDWPFCSIAELTKALRARRISASELLVGVIARIEASDKRINAVVVRDFDHAQAMARAADSALASGDRRPLFGIPVTLTEPFNIAGLPTTWGYSGFRHSLPSEEALDRSATSLPVGVEIIRPYLEDCTMLASAELLEREFGGFVPPP